MVEGSRESACVWKYLLLNYLSSTSRDLECCNFIDVCWKDEVRRFVDFKKGREFWESRKHVDSKISDKRAMVYNAPPVSHSYVRCYVTQTKRALRPTIYTMYHEDTTTPLLTAKLTKVTPTKKIYSIYLSHNEKESIGKLVSSSLGLHFKYIDKGSRDTKVNINYSSNLIRRSYNKLSLEISDVSHSDNFVISNQQEPRKLKNRDPVWDPQYHSWTLNFGGRVKRKSARNFQIMEQNEQKQHNFLIFGRIDAESFVLDYRNPFTALQAYCLALSALDRKIACM